jgi:hypothetical protein
VHTLRLCGEISWYVEKKRIKEVIVIPKSRSKDEHLITMASTKELPPMARYPEAGWRAHMMPEDWNASLDAWIILAEAHLSLSPPEFEILSIKDESLSAFLLSYTFQMASSHDVGQSLDPTGKSKTLRKYSFLLTKRLLETSPPETILSWAFLADMSKFYGKTMATKLLGTLWKPFPPRALEFSLASVKSSLISGLDMGMRTSSFISGAPRELSWLLLLLSLGLKLPRMLVLKCIRIERRSEESGANIEAVEPPLTLFT